VTASPRHRLRLAASIVCTVLVGSVLCAAPAQAGVETVDVLRDYTLTRASVSSTGEEVDGASTRPSVSDDGRFVAFESDASFDGASGRLWLRDLEGGVSPVSTYEEEHLTDVPLFGYRPALSGDGGTLAFATVAAATTAEVHAAELDGPSSQEQLVQVWDAVGREVTTVDTSIPMYAIDTVAVDDVGDRVVFTADVHDPAEAGAPDWRVFVADVGEPAVELGDAGGAEGPPGASISGDGSRALWRSFDAATTAWTLLATTLGTDASTVDPADTDVLGTVDEAGDALSWYGEPAVSDDGTVVVTSVASESGFVVERWIGEDHEVLAPFTGAEPTVTSGMLPAVSDDGAVVAFLGLLADGEGFHVFAWDEAEEALSLVSSTPDGLDGSCGGEPCEGAGVDAPAVDATGDVIAFSSEYGDLVADDANGVIDVFVADRLERSARPTWPAGAGLRVTDVTEDTVTLAWDEATDDVGVTGYRVRVQGTSAALATTGPHELAYTTGPVLPSGTTSTFFVQAIDADGQTSVALSVDATTDTPAPVRPLRVLDVRSHDLGGAALTWPATDDPSISGWQVVRAPLEGGDEEVLAEVPLGTPSYRDSSGLAGGAYVYRIDAVTADGVEPYTWDDIYVFDGLYVDEGTWSVGGDWPSLLEPGASFELSVDGTRGRTATARISYRTYAAGDPTAVGPVTTAVVALEEVDPGRYTANWSLPDRTTTVTAIELAVGDGVDERVTSVLGGPLTVGSRLTVTTSGSAASVAGARLFVNDRTTWRGDAFDLEATNSHDLGLVWPGDDVALSLYAADGYLLAELEDQQIPAGAPVTIGLTPQLPASVAVTVVDDEGAVVDGARVTATDEDGRFLDAGWTARGIVTLDGLREGHATHVVVARPDRSLYQPSADATFLPEAGENAQVLTLPGLPRTTLQGTVTRDGGVHDGGPVHGARVAVSQDVAGAHYSTSTETDADGHYELEVLEGTATVSVGSYSEGTQDATVEVGSGGAVHDVAYVAPDRYTLRLSLATQYAGEAVFPVELDWRSAVHYGLHAAGPTHVEQIRGATHRFSGRPGETVEVCASGAEGGLPDACQSIVLPEETFEPIDIDLLLAQSVGIEGTVVHDGEPLAYVVADLYLVTPDGERWVAEQRVHGDGHFAFDADAAGDHVVRFRRGDLVASRSVAALEAGQSIDLGEIEVAARGASVFAGTGNSVTPSRPAVFAGGLVELRTAFHPGRAVTGAEAILDVPADATVPADGVTLDGELVPYTVSDGAVHVELGDLAANEDGVLRMVLRVAADAPTGTLLTSIARIGYGSGTVEEVAIGSTEVGGVTIEAPRRTTTREVAVSGRAGSGETVEILAGRAVVGTAVASTGGYWSQAVTLPDLGPAGTYRLRARVGDGVDAPVSDTVAVRLDVRDPVVEEVVVEQRDGREVRFDPRAGVARFPYVFVPGMPTTVKVRFDRPDDVEDVQIRILDEEATATLDADGSYVAEFRMQTFGTIAVAYDVKPASFSPGAAPTEEQLRQRLPSGLAQFEVLPLVDEANVPGSGAGRFTADLGDGSSLDVEVDVQATSYEPTSEERARAEASGIPVYASALAYEGDGTTAADGDGDLEATLTAYVDCAALPAGACDGITGGATAAAGFRAAGAVGAIAKVVTKVKNINSGVDEAGTNAFNNLTGKYAVDQSWGAGDKYDKVGELYDMLADCPPEVDTTRFRQRIDRSLGAAAASDVISAGLSLAGLVLGGPLGAVGAFVLTEAASQAVGFALGATLDGDRADLTAACPPGAGTGRGRRGTVLADPTAIYDPSGFVYEGLESNRLEGVTATVLYSADGIDGWQVWDAGWFGQENPLVTDAEGRYGWDVPEGFWQVVYTKDGYRTATSEVLEVLPPHFDVDEGLVSLSPPSVTSVTATSGAVDVTFSQPMVVASVTLEGRVAVAVAGLPVEGTVTAVAAENDPNGRSLASTFRFTPSTAFGAGTALDVAVGAAVQSYGLRGLRADHTSAVTVPVPPVDGDGDGDGGGGSGDGADTRGRTVAVPAPSAPGAPVTVSVRTSAGPVRVVLHGARPGRLSVEVVDRPVTVPGLRTLATSFQVSSTASFESAEVCFPYDAGELVAAGVEEDRLALFHGAGGRFTDVTTDVAVDRHEVCGATTSFSPFVLGATRTTRLAGVDRYATAAAISARAFPDGAPVAVLASGLSPADALVAGPVAARLGGPVLLTAPDGLPAATLAELERLDPTRVVVAGGSSAVDDAVLDRVREATGLEVARVAGADRYATAGALAGLVGSAADDVVYLASGASSADALSGGALAGSRGSAVLLTDPQRLSSSTADALRGLRPSRVVVLGGTAAVSDAVLAAAGRAAGGVATSRLAGADRYGTAAAVAVELGSRSVFVATGASSADALAAVAAAVRTGSALVLVRRDAVPAATRSALQAMRPSSVTVVGGTAAVARSTEVEVAATMP
jgi:putative cell wall-binding protein